MAGLNNDYYGGPVGGNPYRQEEYPLQPPQQPIPPLGVPQVPGVRPRVDPNADGEVDLSIYPDAKDSTKKVRGRTDIVEMLFGSMSQELLMAKTFYFFFFSAFGSLFPLMGVYFKQLGLNPFQCGILSGLRPLVEYLAVPFWAGVSERQNKGKMIMLGSIVCFIVFTMALNFVQSPAVGCLKHNGTDYILEVPDETINERPDYDDRDRDREEEEEDEDVVPVEVRERRSIPTHFAWTDPYGEKHRIVVRRRRQADPVEFDSDPVTRTFTGALSGSLNFQGDAVGVKDYLKQHPELKDLEYYAGEDNTMGNGDRQQHSLRVKRASRRPGVGHVIGTSPLQVEFVVNYKEKDHETWFSPPNSNMVYASKDVQKVFFLLLLLILIGEALGAPALTLADSSVLSALGDDAEHYGWQRMFGSAGWGVAMFFVGIALDHSTDFPDHPCRVHRKERNYTICFAVFSVLMGCAGITATQFKFPETAQSDNIRLDDINKDPNAEKDNKEYKFQLEGNPVPDPVAEPVKPPADLGKSKVFAQQMPKETPEWMKVFRHFANPKCAAFLFVAWLMGFGIGLIFTFLFWHLQDFGGTPTLFGIASVINHISEIFAYFFSFRLITQIGHVKVLCLGLIGNVVRFLYISWLRNPWWVLPFEFMQGITHATVWAACCSYIAHVTPMDLRPSANGVLQGLHHGFGRACGAVIGGALVRAFGSQATFRAYGFFCLFVLIVFIFIHFFKDGKFQTDLSDADDPRVVAGVSHLDPHGVPANPMPRALSSARINEMGDQGNNQQQYTSSGPNLGLPGAEGGFGGGRNPFLGGGNIGGGDFGGGGSGGGYNYQMQQMDTTSDVEEDLFPSPTSSTNPFTDPALGLKPKALRSPDVMVDLDWIRQNFNSYNDVLRELVESEEKLLNKGPVAKTKFHIQQPVQQYEVNEYDW